MPFSLHHIWCDKPLDLHSLISSAHSSSFLMTYFPGMEISSVSFYLFGCILLPCHYFTFTSVFGTVDYRPLTKYQASVIKLAGALFVVTTGDNRDGSDWQHSIYISSWKKALSLMTNRQMTGDKKNRPHWHPQLTPTLTPKKNRPHWHTHWHTSIYLW